MTAGVVAAGHEATAGAGAEILRAGGTAIDAAIAAAFAGCVVEQPIFGFGGGGFMLVHDAAARSETLLDFFIAMPGKGLDAEGRSVSPLVPTPVDFGGTIQMFRAGSSSVGVPGFVLGLCEAHRRWATMSLADLVDPARHLARDGFPITRQQEYLFTILEPMLSVTPRHRALFYRGDEPLRDGELSGNRDIVVTLDAIAERGAEDFYRGGFAERLVAEMAALGGWITAEDLATYSAVERQPVRITYRDVEFVSNPPPSSGGSLLAYALRLLGEFDLSRETTGPDHHLRHIIEAMIATNAARAAHLSPHGGSEDALERLLAEELILQDRRQMSSRLGNTSHISTLDSQGNAVSLTGSNGEGSGLLWPGTGISLNNMLGEEDLVPEGVVYPAGERLTSMMAPSLLLRGGRPVLTLGSAGSIRIRGAILQVIANVVDRRMELQEAVDAPRVHVEGDTVELEPGLEPDVVERLTAAGYRVRLWKERNLYFGGVQAAAELDAGHRTGAGDPRRGGVAIVVG
jgi:gamma-glutamyltranspeptidase/glutathione hydrolase